MIYLVCFALSAGLAYYANKFTDNRKKFLIFSFASIAVMVLLAGLRDYSIGIDVNGYLTKPRYWKNAIRSESLSQYMEYYLSLDLGEPLFALLIGMIAQITGEYRVFLFVAHIIIITGVYVGVFRQRKYVNPAFVLLIYYFFFFNHSLNVIRQHMAMAIVFAALADIQEKKYLRYCIAVAVAMMFHTTAILSIGLLLVHIILNYQHDKLKNVKPIHRKAFIVVGLSSFVILFIPLVRLLMKIGLLNERYNFFIENENVSPALIVSALVVFGLVAVFYFKDQIKEKYPESDFFIMCSAVYLILLQLTLFLSSGKRIALYFALADIVTLGLVQSSQKDKKTKLLVTCLIIAVALDYWLYIYVLRNASQTFPYLLGI